MSNKLIEEEYKVIKNEEEKSIKHFDNYFQSSQEEQYKEIEKLYNHIRESYERKFKNDKIKIKIEKMNLERNIGKYQGSLRKGQITLFIGIFGIMIQLMIPIILELLKINNQIIELIAMLIWIICFIYSISKESNKQRPKDLMYYVALQVLNDIGKECSLEDNLDFDESAATNLEDSIKEKSNKKKYCRSMKGFINFAPIIKIERRK